MKTPLRVALLAIAGGVVVLAAGAAVAVSMASSVPEEAASPSPSPSATPEPLPAVMPTTSLARAGVEAWELAPRTALASVLPELGSAPDGTIALRLDAPVVDEETTAASVRVPVEGGTEYTFTALVRGDAAYPEAVPAALIVGDERLAMPRLSADWKEITADFVAPADAEEVEVRLVVTAPVSAFALDNVRLIDPAGENAVPNPSFEATSTERGIVNDSLVFSGADPLLAVNVPRGDVSWTAVPSDGGAAVSGSAGMGDGLRPLLLDGVGQGHYEFVLTDAQGQEYKTALAVIDHAGAPASQDPRFGVGLHVERDWYEGAATLAAALGFAEARNDVNWARNETRRGEYDWHESYVREFDRAHVNGVHVLGIVDYSNTLYGPQKAPSTQEAIAAYGRYARAIADRFDLVGLEVYNEFNIGRFNDSACGTAADCYLPLVQAVDAELGEEHADLPVVVGSAALYDRPWFQRLWQIGGLEYADAISYHPYEVTPFKPDDLADVVQASREDMRAVGDERPVWITELGWTSKTGATSLVEQGEMLVRAEVSALSAGAEKYFWYDLVNDSANRDDHEGNFGLYEQLPRPGVVALAPKPAAFAQALLIAQLGGRPYSESQSDSEAKVHLFGEGKDIVRVAWAPGGSGQVAFESSADVVATGLDGSETIIEPIEGVVSVPITNVPTFIRAADSSPNDPSPAPTATPSPSQ